MSTPIIKIQFESAAHLESEFNKNLTHGGTFIQGSTSLQEHDLCQIELVHPSNQCTLIVEAKAVWIAPDNEGFGVALLQFGPVLREKISTFIEQNHQNQPDTDPNKQPGIEPPPPNALQQDFPILHAVSDKTSSNQTIHERLRNLSIPEQQKVARGGNANERIILERIYGKSVWEALLRNNRLTIPEVARIARMGALPKPLMDVIVSNITWVSSPPVRRALLTNPRLSRDQIPKVLQAMPQAELRLIPKQMAYTSMVRETARRLLRR